MTKLSLWLMRQGIPLHRSRVRHPQTQGKVERFHGELQRALARRGMRGSDAQVWLDEFRWEHNHVRPHEALGMQTPATRWHRSARRYEANPPRWEYPAGTRVLKVDSRGKVTLVGKNWTISDALAGEWVQVMPVGNRLQVYYCRTLVLQPNARSKSVRDVLGRFVSHVLGLDSSLRGVGLLDEIWGRNPDSPVSRKLSYPRSRNSYHRYLMSDNDIRAA